MSFPIQQQNMGHSFSNVYNNQDYKKNSFNLNHSYNKETPNNKKKFHSFLQLKDEEQKNRSFNFTEK